MKNKFIIIVMLISSMAYSQSYGYKWSTRDRSDYVYFNTSFDVNMAFGLNDNKDTALFDDRGLDFDLELGVRDNHVGIYIFYGSFNAMDYKNYGGGVDYYVHWLRETRLRLYNPFTGERGTVFQGIDLSIGVAYGVLIRDGNFTFNGNHIRGVATFWISENIGVTGRFQFTQAGDLPNKEFRKEGSIGITIKFDRN